MLFVARRKCDNVLREAGDFVDLLFDRETRAQVVELHGAGGFGKDREGERIPLGQDLAVRDGFAFDTAEACAIHNVVTLFFAALFVNDGDQARAIHRDVGATATFDVLEIHELDDAVVARFESGTLGNAGGGSADVEGTHGELRAGFADGLRGDDADGFAEFDHAARSEVAAVAQSANTASRFAGEHGTDADAFDTGALNRVRKLFGDFLVDVNDDVAFEVLDLVERDAANDTVAERFDFDAGFDDGFDEDAVGGAAIALVDDHVLRDVYEAASEVARIGGLKSGIGQALTRTVRGDEVLQHVEAFAEVGSNRRLDNFARRLRHQSAHAGELTNLLFRSASAGVGHDVDGVDAAFLVLVLEGLEEFVGDFFGDVAPDGDDFVIAFFVRSRGVEVLVGHIGVLLFGVLYGLLLAARDED